ncbi:cupin domain-containing protein [Runella zeae]|uniref:cupin domain-containing protein n=1 Tax=Runella zeae TaxID=94255 RepID=UPI0003F57BAF|nr:cupin domain-containing protein [Runella zeae]
MVMFANKVSLAEAHQKLGEVSAVFLEVFRRGTLSVELYHPEGEDKQTPHSRDEVYIIAAGEAVFELEGQKTQVKTGDFLFVPAQAEHRFVEFSENFSTWVLFYGPEGGENALNATQK